MRLYDRLIQSLLLEMGSGYYREGDRFFSYRKICQLYHVSLPTAKTAIAWMIGNHLLKAEHKSGLYLQTGFRQQALFLYHKKSGTPALPAPQDWNHRRFHLAARNSSERRVVAAAIEQNAPGVSLFSDISSNLADSSLKCAHGFASAAQQEGITPLFMGFGLNERDLEALVNTVIETGAQGLAIFHRSALDSIQQITASLLLHRIPVVRIFDDCKQMDVVSINFNNIAIGYEAIKSLHELGHRRIAVLSPPPSRKSSDDRVKGARMAAEERRNGNLEELMVREIEEGDGEIIPALLSGEQRPTAFFLTQSWILPMLHQALRHRKYQIPNELSVLVCSGREEMPPFGSPVDAMFLDFEGLGEKALHALKNILDGCPEPKSSLVQTLHKFRGSLAAPNLGVEGAAPDHPAKLGEASEGSIAV